ncbi:MAG TPA: hypothetical protein PKA20_12610 [Burkholderiaceae bacterium]|nr:hypothetical protein [Burkholderiaceae bacterium]
MARQRSAPDISVKLDLNSPEFQRTLFALEKKAAVETLGTLKKICSMSWSQVYRDSGLHWEKIESLKPPKGVDALYSLRVSRSTRAIAYREQEFMRLLLVSADHDAAYGKK